MEVVETYVDILRAAVEALGTLDVLCSLAVVACERDYVRPVLYVGPGEARRLRLHGCRHAWMEVSRGHAHVCVGGGGAPYGAPTAVLA
jgi:DNA mismatch repair ATPase MutS